MNEESLKKYTQEAIDWAVKFAPKVLIAIIIFWVGLRIIQKINKITEKTLASRNIDATIRPFFASLVDVVLRLILFLVVANIFGFETTSFVAVISALAFAVGLALQGSLGHFASGILLLILKPYKVGDEIKIGDAEGFVDEIQVFNTILRTRDNRRIIIPNGVVTSGNIINISGQGIRRVDLEIIIDEPNHVMHVKKILEAAVAECPHLLPDKKTDIFLLNFDTDNMCFAVRPWCKSEDYWEVWAFMQERIKIGFDSADLTGNIQFVQLVDNRKSIMKVED